MKNITEDPFDTEGEDVDSKKVKAVSTEEIDEREKLVALHVELFGKKPAHNASLDTLRNKVDKALADQGEEPAEAEPQEVVADDEPADDFAPTYEDEPAAPIVEDDDVVDEDDVADDEPEDEPVDVYADAEEVSEEQEQAVDAWAKAVKEANSYLDANELRENAGAIIFEAQMDGMSEENIALLKKEINKIYKSLQ